MAVEGERRLAPVEKETGRLEAFSDGVFAVAITLLVLNLSVPDLAGPPSAARLTTALAKQWPSYLAFVTSFGTILIMWVNHHALFKMVRRSDTLFMFANGFLLLLTTVVPFATALVARYLVTPAAPTACAVYAGGFAVVDVAFILLWWSIAHERRLLHPHVPQARVDMLTRRFRIAFPVYLGATLLAFPFKYAYTSIAVCCCLWILWAITGYERTSAHDSP